MAKLRLPSRDRWDLTALLNAADPRAPRAERHLWLVRLMEWLRQAPPPRDASTGDAEADAGLRTPRSLLRLKHLLNVLDKHPEHREHVRGLLTVFWAEIDVVTLLADFGFAHRQGVMAELGERVRLRLLPGSTDTADLSALFGLLFSGDDDARWLDEIDDELLGRTAALFGGDARRWPTRSSTSRCTLPPPATWARCACA